MSGPWRITLLVCLVGVLGGIADAGLDWSGSPTFGAGAAASERRGERAQSPDGTRGANAPIGVTGEPTGLAECDEVTWAIPVHIVLAESRCQFAAVNPTGCLGNGCVGAYQFDVRHWDASTGWGSCADLGGWTDPDAQHACARRLSAGGTNLAPWGH